MSRWSPRSNEIPGGFKVLDSTGQPLAYVYGRETKADADTAHVFTLDEARRIASNIAKLPNRTDLVSDVPQDTPPQYRRLSAASGSACDTRSWWLGEDKDRRNLNPA